MAGPGDAKMDEAPSFNEGFRAALEKLFRWRRDVRHFRPDPVDRAVIRELVDLACVAPSVGYSQPWRFVSVDSAQRRRAVRENFLACNRDALEDYQGERARLYASLKLAGLDQAPVQLAVFVDEGTRCGHGLGRKTMPETLAYSVVMAVHTLWLAARARGIGVGWVSILDAGEIEAILEVPGDWSLVAYLCVGYPEAEEPEPELLRRGWEEPHAAGHALLER
jgi:5,6-dimethylbenzimidazole synthase